jgi:hypothetical protein
MKVLITQNRKALSPHEVAANFTKGLLDQIENNRLLHYNLKIFAEIDKQVLNLTFKM